MQNLFKQATVSSCPQQPALLASLCNCCSRYDYEECDSQAAENMMNHVRQVIASSPPGTKFGAFELALADDFEYTDPIDGSVAKKQGLRFIFKDGSRIIFRCGDPQSAPSQTRTVS